MLCNMVEHRTVSRHNGRASFSFCLPWIFFFFLAFCVHHWHYIPLILHYNSAHGILCFSLRLTPAHFFFFSWFSYVIY